METYYEDAGITLYHGNALEVLPRLKPASVDLCLTDCPFGIKYQTNHRAKNDPLRKPISGDHNLDTLRQVAPLIDRVMRNDRHLYFFASSNSLRLGETASIVSEYWKLKNTLVWDKGEMGSVGDLESGYAVNWEGILYATKGRRKLNGARPRSIYRQKWSGKNDQAHPHTKPVGLLQWLIKNSTSPDEVILDSFSGTGTVLRAAKNLGRRAIGIELSEEYCARAVARLKDDD